jgi:arylsulfatase
MRFRTFALLIAALFPAFSAAAGNPPNIVVLLADDWRFDTLGIAGNPVVKTPHLDRLAARGVRFTHARVTTSICGVSRSSILTGQWMSRHGNRAFATMDTPWTESYPGLLRKNGYHVGHVGKWHSGPFPAREFDFARSYAGRHWVKRADGTEVHVTRKNEEDALDFLSQRPKDQPFLLNLWFFAPHAEDNHPDQFLPQPESMSLYQDLEIPIPPLHTSAALSKLPKFLQQPENEGRVRYHWRFDDPEKYQRMMKNYYRLCSEVDAVCGRIIDELEKQNQLENTLIIFLGDNGYYHGDRGLADKWYPHEESIRVPFIVYDPRLPAEHRGITRDEFVLNVDIAPALLAAAGIDAPERMQGRDFSTLYLQETSAAAPWRDEFFYEHGTISNKDRIPSSEAVVRRDFKYTWWPEHEHEELFDLTTDPSELENLAGSPGHQEKLAEMRAKLKQMKDSAR